MAQTPNRSTNMIRRQSFNGKGLTFVEVIFAQSMTTTATTPDTKDSDFQKVSEVLITMASRPSGFIGLSTVSYTHLTLPPKA